MTRAGLVTAALSILAVASCAHPEDKRWHDVYLSRTTLPQEQQPSVRVYSFEPPSPPPAKTKITSLAGEGQAALIDGLAHKKVDADVLRTLSKPLEGQSSDARIDRTRLDRTVVISVSKALAALPGDRLVKTRVTLTPENNADGERAFEFAGYTVAATDSRVQNIAHLEDQTDLSLSGSVAPKIGGFGDNGIEAKAGHTRTTTADITQQYENLNIDITPGDLVVTRESERGLDLVGNTIIALTLAAPDGYEGPSAFLASGLKLYEKGVPLSEAQGNLEATPLTFFARCPLAVTVKLEYQLRRIIRGRQFYTEGRQDVELITTQAPESTRQVLVRASEAQGALFQVVDIATGKGVLLRTATGDQRIVYFDDFDDARSLAAWLSATRRSTIGTTGLRFTIDGAPPALGATYRAQRHVGGCPLTRADRK